MGTKVHVIQSQDSKGHPVMALRPLAEGTEAVASGTASSAFTSNAVRLVTTGGNTRIRFGTAAVATTAGVTDILLIQNIPEYFSVIPGQILWNVGFAVDVTCFEVG